MQPVTACPTPEGDRMTEPTDRSDDTHEQGHEQAEPARTAPGPNAPQGGWDEDDLADEMSEESFPTSDPPSTWAGSDHG
jgi:hypothetical protein